MVTWWDNSGEDGSGTGVFGQIFNATGAKIGNEFQVNTHTAGNQKIGNQKSHTVCSLSTGNFVVTWWDESGEDGNETGVFGQIFNATAVSAASTGTLTGNVKKPSSSTSNSKTLGSGL